MLMLSSPSPPYRECVISSNTCRTICSCHLLPLAGSRWSLPILAQQHAHAVLFTRQQRVYNLVRCLRKSMLMRSSLLPTYSLYVIPPDNCRRGCSCWLLLLPIGSMWSCPIAAEQHADAAFLLSHLQKVSDLVRHLQNSMLMPSSSLTYSLYVILSDICGSLCWWCLLHPLTACRWSCPKSAEQHAHTLPCLFTGGAQSSLIPAEQHIDTLFSYPPSQNVSKDAVTTQPVPQDISVSIFE